MAKGRQQRMAKLRRQKREERKQRNRKARTRRKPALTQTLLKVNIIRMCGSSPLPLLPYPYFASILCSLQLLDPLMVYNQSGLDIPFFLFFCVCVCVFLNMRACVVFISALFFLLLLTINVSFTV